MRGRLLLFCACYFLTGAASLIHEICWIRKASLAFGSTTFAVSTILAIFFLGLALGSAVFGNLSPRIRHPMRIYALLEIGLALAVILTFPAFSLAESLYGHAYRTLGSPGLLFSARVGLVALVLLVPTFLMGGTLPLFCRQFVESKRKVAGPVGLLYALNTLGAAIGCSLAGFLLVPSLGVTVTILIGVSLNLGIGVTVFLVGGRQITDSFANEESTNSVSPALLRDQLVLSFLFFLAGFVALAHEVLWTRFLALVVRTSTYTYTITLTSVLIGIVLGSLLSPLVFDRRIPRGMVFGAIHVLIGLYVLGVMVLPTPTMWEAAGGELWIHLTVLLPPAFLSGASFPLAVRMVVEDPRRAGVRVGRIAALTTMGGILGALMAGFLGLPHLGLQLSITLTTGLSLSIGIAAWIFLDHGVKAPAKAIAIVGCFLGWIIILLNPKTQIPRDFLAGKDRLVAYREGLEANLAVVRRDDQSLHLEIDRWWQGQDRKGHQVVAAHVPLLVHPEPKKALVVGVGVGQTPARFLLYDIERLDCVDIEPGVFDLIRAHFPSAWMEDERTHILREDGRSYINHTSETYDVISLELGQLFRPGVGAFYSVEFYEKARVRLKPGGVLSQFVPLPFLSGPTLRRIVATFVRVFPQCVLWYNTSELLLVGRNADRLSLSENRLRRMLADERINDDLRFSYWGGSDYWLCRPEVFLAGYLCGPTELADFSKDASVLCDDRPALEFLTDMADDSKLNEISILDELKPRLGSVVDILQVADGAMGKESPPQIAVIERIRTKNLGDVVASAYLRGMEQAKASGNIKLVSSLLDQALEANPENATARRLLADTLVLSNRLPEAEAHYQTALAARPDDGLANRGLAFALHQLGKIDEAIHYYRAAVKFLPDDAEAHNNLGAALGKQGDLAAARFHFEQAVQCQPDHADALRNLERLK